MRSLSLVSVGRLAMGSYKAIVLQIETAADGAKNRLRHLILGSIRGDHPATVGIAPRHVQKGLAQSFMEIDAEFLKAVFGIAARQGPFQSPCNIQVQDQGEI